jgi:hypothetical protein
MTQPILKNLAQLEKQEINAVVTLILLSGVFAFTLSLASIFLSLIISTLIVLTYVSLRTITTRKHNNIQFEIIYNLQKELQKSLMSFSISDNFPLV